MLRSSAGRSRVGQIQHRGRPVFFHTWSCASRAPPGRCDLKPVPSIVDPSSMNSRIPVPEPKPEFPHHRPPLHTRVSAVDITSPSGSAQVAGCAHMRHSGSVFFYQLFRQRVAATEDVRHCVPARRTMPPHAEQDYFTNRFATSFRIKHFTSFNHYLIIVPCVAFA